MNSNDLLRMLAAIAVVIGIIANTVSGLDCFTDSSGTVKEDCGMHTGCMKKFDMKTQLTLQRSCFLTPGQNDTCFTDGDNGFGVCYCHSDLCNHAARPTAIAVEISAAAALVVMTLWKGTTFGR